MSRQSRLLTFLEWIAVFLEFGCKAGLVAVEEIKPNSTLIELDLDDVMYSFPLSSLIPRCPSTVLKSVPASEKDLFLAMSDDLMLTAFLIQERIKGTASRWYPWLQVLTSSFSCLSDTSEASHGSFIVHPVGNQRIRGSGDHPAPEYSANGLLSYLFCLHSAHVHLFPANGCSLPRPAVGLQLFRV